MTSFFDDHLVIHPHIEKTAGSTLVRGFMREFGREHVCDVRPSHTVKPEFLDEEAKRNIYLVTGHFHYGTQDRHFRRRGIYVACVRPPLSRYRSYYNFVRVRSGHPGYASMQGKTFAEMVEEFLAGDRRRANVMSRTITGNSRPDRKQVLASAEANYAIITPHDRVNDTLRTLLPIFGGRLGRKNLHMNRGGSEPAEDIGPLADKFAAANSLDCELYDYVRERYDTWLADLGRRVRLAPADAG